MGLQDVVKRAGRSSHGVAGLSRTVRAGRSSHSRECTPLSAQIIVHLLGLLLMLPGHATFRNLSRYSAYHERTFDDRHFDFVALNKAAITQVMAPEHQQALVIDASFIPKSGTHTYGLERFWTAASGAVKKVWKSPL